MDHHDLSTRYRCNRLAIVERNSSDSSFIVSYLSSSSSGRTLRKYRLMVSSNAGTGSRGRDACKLYRSGFEPDNTFAIICVKVNKFVNKYFVTNQNNCILCFINKPTYSPNFGGGRRFPTRFEHPSLITKQQFEEVAQDQGEQ